MAIEPFNLGPYFLEDLVSDSLFYAVPGSVIRVKLPGQIAFQSRIPDITDIRSIRNVRGEFDQLSFCLQCTTFPFLPLIINGNQKFAQSNVQEEIPLMKVREIMDEQLHVASPLAQNQARLALGDGISAGKFLKGTIGNRIAANITQSKRHARLPHLEPTLTIVGI